MYEDYLESFVFKTAKLIAMKLFGRERKPRNEDDEPENSEPSKTEDEKELDLNIEGDPEELIQKIENMEDKEEVDKIIHAIMKKKNEEKKRRDNNPSKVDEYRALTEGLDEINFHFPIFFLLIVISILAIPSTITWAKNYHYSTSFSPDPFRIPAMICLISLGVLWQLETPRNL